MNILFFLIPKSKVAYVEDDFTLRQVMEKLYYHQYTAIPLLDKKGRYVETIAEGDILSFLREHSNLCFKDAENVPILDLKVKRDIKPIKSTARMEDLYNLVLNQNFVPVIDDLGIFIGIVTRNAIMKYMIMAK